MTPKAKKPISKRRNSRVSRAHRLEAAIRETVHPNDSRKRIRMALDCLTMIQQQVRGERSQASVLHGLTNDALADLMKDAIADLMNLTGTRVL